MSPRRMGRPAPAPGGQAADDQLEAGRVEKGADQEPPQNLLSVQRDRVTSARAAAASGTVSSSSVKRRALKP